MARMTGGGALVEMLRRHGVDTLFALPGVQNDALFVALYDAGETMRVIHPRHEQAAAYMAFGYARASGRPGAYAVVPGPGVLNTTAALATAYAANAPVLCISGQIPSNLIGRGFGLLHEVPDQLAILKGLTKWAARIDHPSETGKRVNEAFRQLAGLARMVDPRGKLGQPAEDRQLVGDLVQQPEAAADQVGRDLPGDAQDRRIRRIGGGERRGRVQEPRPGHDGERAGPAARPRIAERHIRDRKSVV